MTGGVLSIFVMITVCVVILFAASVATKSKLPLLEKVCEVAFRVPSFVEAVTVTSRLVGAVLYGSIVTIGAILSMFVMVTVLVVELVEIGRAHV